MSAYSETVADFDFEDRPLYLPGQYVPGQYRALSFDEPSYIGSDDSYLEPVESHSYALSVSDGSESEASFGTDPHLYNDGSGTDHNNTGRHNYIFTYPGDYNYYLSDGSDNGADDSHDDSDDGNDEDNEAWPAFPRVQEVDVLPAFPVRSTTDRLTWAAQLGSHAWRRSADHGDFDELVERDVFACAILDMVLEQLCCLRNGDPGRGFHANNAHFRVAVVRTFREWRAQTDMIIAETYHLAVASLPASHSALAPPLPGAVDQFLRAALDRFFRQGLDAVNAPSRGDIFRAPLVLPILGRFDVLVCAHAANLARQWTAALAAQYRSHRSGAAMWDVQARVQDMVPATLATMHMGTTHEHDADEMHTSDESDDENAGPGPGPWIISNGALAGWSVVSTRVPLVA